uniref:Transient receptor potential cation channel, subfamily M, member 2 n=1 Tax=Danio rerio TaxID=7955 RepID=UPI0004F4953D|nr:transient receptor potential cation channel subfamily M member 2 isoform X2 [Danio rerio]6DRK_A Chain A, Transient receptor potential cation channel, subfamily M, member 2 [Danio rerio]6DRK_B Chain B, Transient receptor potential cation channel, subfamily M, member 2 [Danio rerio]6DRK_C Chain C, Transient receptor potential cation channel, subfamily M, member 2 [Danio rerio]6DRK_D Chain D, Transient receptor potential cation channel, subfamily M, member 2 [Danio rerio]|eukprot:XP_009303267.1 transient receptor potential cation channel subfamily M member 2 isoform X2 [Danio rerio]
MLGTSGVKIHPNGNSNQLGVQLENVKLTSLFKKLDKRCSLASWIKENIKKKECCFYVEDGREGICKCGYPKVQHCDEAIKPEDYMGEQWDKHRHVRETPTDAFGDISFGGLGQKTGKYVRVSSDTSCENLYQLMTEQWKLRSPNLLISVTGGAKNFYIKTHLKDKFRRGLIKVAQTTGAWILTGGTHAGVMKHVGMAVRDYTLSSGSMEGQIVVIGVAPWGVIHNRSTLIHPEGRFPAYYSLDEQGQGRLSCLDINHTHFLLVDDGTQGHYGVEIELRARLEKLISKLSLGNRESGVTIPVVCVVLDGGPGTLNTIYNSMLNHTPCVVLEGSGRLADVIAHVASVPVSKVTMALINRLLKRFFMQEYKNFTELQIIEWTKKIQDILRMPHLLTVFRIDEDKNYDVDVAILQALLKASRSDEHAGRHCWERQLELAVAWNRVDIAESEIFTEESQWTSSDLHPAMFSALVGDKPEFVRLLLENGVCVREFLEREETLCELYSHLPSCFFLRKLAKRVQGGKMRRGQEPLPGSRKVCLSHVSEEVRHLLGSFTQPLYIASRYKPTKDDVRLKVPSKGALDLPCSGEEWSADTVWDPGRDLFLWAVVQNNRELAEIGWEQCRDCIAAALAASKILRKLAQESGEDDSEEATEMLELANHYEKQAIGVFSECHSWDAQRAQKLLIRISPSWGRSTCLWLALEAHDKSFIAHSGVQALLTQIWCGELSVDNPHWKVLLCMIFFPLIYTGFLTFRRDEDIQRQAERTEQQKLAMESVFAGQSDGKIKRHLRGFSQKSELKPLNCSSRLMSFLKSPQVKFYWNIASYFGFLWLFAVVLMIDFQTSPSWRELLLYVWLTSLVCEEIRQLYHDFDGSGFRRKAKMYIKDLWNILDVLSIVLFIAGLICRLQASDTVFYIGKVILCIDFIIFCLRLMAIFSISRTLGPKIIIVRRMMLDLFFFMFLLSIWVVAYGVAKQGILIENEERLNWIIRGAVYEPYITIFGNFPTNIDNTLFDISSCSVNASDPLKPKCPMLNADNTPVFPEWLTIMMLCVYLLFANILLLNLLIAIFNYTFQEVQDNTDTIWKFQRYELIKEYHSRPALPPPFILLSHLILFIRGVFLRDLPQRHKNFRQELEQTEEEELLSWEAYMKDNYLASTRQDESQSVEHRIHDTAEKVGAMSELLEREQEMVSATMAKRLARLEEQVSESAKALRWIIDALKSQGCKSKVQPPLMRSKSSDRDDGDSSGQETDDEEAPHMFARQLQYPDSTVRRFPVPEEKVSWEVNFSPYQPPVYNQQDSSESDTSALDKHRNPGGRTGIRGKGALNTLGPNHILHPIFTRWRDAEHKVLEFLAVWEDAEKRWALLGGPAQPDEPLAQVLERILGKKLNEKTKTLLKAGEEVYKGYVDDSRNTDNAWVETSIITLHCDKNTPLMADLNHMVESSLSSHQPLQWREVSSDACRCSYQREALRQIAHHHNTYF